MTRDAQSRCPVDHAALVAAAAPSSVDSVDEGKTRTASASPVSDAPPCPITLPTKREHPFEPPHELAELRKSHPLTRMRYEDGTLGWLVTSHELARAVLGDARFSVYPGGFATDHPDKQASLLLDAIEYDTDFPDIARNLVDGYHRDGRLTDAFRDPQVLDALHEHSLSKLPFFSSDPPKHTRMRRILSGYFSPRRVTEYQDLVERIVANRLDAMERAGGPVDLVEAFAGAIPSMMTCALFGVPESERGTMMRLFEARANPNSTPDDYVRVHDEFHAFCRDLIAKKRAQPGEDLLSNLVHGGRMSDDELVATAVILVRAAQETTSATIASGVFTLLHDRARWEALKSDPASAVQVVEEVLRFTSVSQVSNIRRATEDVELGGTVIKAHELVTVSMPAANRDPHVFADPNRFDPTRPSAAQHVTFSYGMHQCLGQHLVRQELRTAFTALAARFPKLDFAVPVAEIPWHPDIRVVRGPQRLLVTW
ncbi:cytochrome P450 [Streptomyces sp. NPDC001508]|uniref:cytochrome P450 n=1 Tax=Streptomyces sp. NPDC001508 TaxID=3154656 RepID=UPI00331B871C